MAKCSRCGKKGLFLKLMNGLCLDCVSIVSAEERDKKRNAPPDPAIERKSAELSKLRAGRYLDQVEDRKYRYSSISGEYIAVYNYSRLYVTDVNQSMLQHLCEARKYVVSPIIDNNGDILLAYQDAPVCKLAECVEMCRDWIQRDDPIHCEFVSFQTGREYVAMTFYRKEPHLNDLEYEIIKLPGFYVTEMQFTIDNLRSGAKLLYSDDSVSERIYVCDLDYNPIGCLPIKHHLAIKNGSTYLLYLDHIEFTDDNMAVPYVRVYK